MRFMREKTFLLPSKITFEGYARVFKEKSIATGYINSIYYMILGTVVSVALIITTGYCVSKKTLPFRRSIMLFYVFTMYLTELDSHLSGGCQNGAA